MSLTLFDQSVKAALSFAVASHLEDVPEEPGVYAWYLPFRGDTAGDLLRFLKTLEENIRRGVPATAVHGASKQNRFTVERNAPAFNLSSAVIGSLAETLRPSQVQSLASAVLVLSILSEPFYIGMTESQGGLKSRLFQHLASIETFDKDIRWCGSLRTRVAKAVQDPAFLQKCIVAYMPISRFDLGTNAARLLEHILIKIVSPAQSLRG